MNSYQSNLKEIEFKIRSSTRLDQKLLDERTMEWTSSTPFTFLTRFLRFQSFIFIHFSFGAIRNPLSIRCIKASQQTLTEYSRR